MTTVTFKEIDGKSRVVLHEAYPTKEALDESQAGMEKGTCEQFEQLDDLLIALDAKA